MSHLIENNLSINWTCDLQANKQSKESVINYSESIKSNLIVTLGEKGASYIENGVVKKVDAPKVKAIDTTGAGDAFVGAFSYAIASDFTIEDSVKLGIERASDSVTKPGTQSSYSK